jgi:hypothetical protein
MDANPELLPIGRIAEKIGLSEDHLDPYGCYTAKINRLPPADAPGNGKLILVTGLRRSRSEATRSDTSWFASVWFAIGFTMQPAFLPQTLKRVERANTRNPTRN